MIAPPPFVALQTSDRHTAVLLSLWAAMLRLDPNPDIEAIKSLEASAAQVSAWHMQHPDCDLAGILTASQGLAMLAELCGAVVTITQEPLQPLRIGNYVHKVAVRIKGAR